MYHDRLSALDSSFLDLEDENTHMHVAVAMLFDPGPLATTDGSIDMEKVRDFVASRLHLLPRYRQRLAFAPISGHPLWVDDPHFNAFYHMRHTSLPKPGSIRQLKRLCGRILSQKLDRSKPLWELWVIEGVEGGRFAVVTKVHHCMVDGAAGTELLTVLLSASSETTFEAAPPWIPRRRPRPMEMLQGEIEHRLDGLGSMVTAAASGLMEPTRAWEETKEFATGVWESLENAATSASDTPLNPRSVGPHRRFDWLRLDLDAVKRVKEHFGATINDVVLATVAGGVRRFLEMRGMIVHHDFDFRVVIPVNLRATDSHHPGNHVAQMFAHLPVEERDPAARISKVCATVRSLKQSHQVEATEILEALSDWAAPSLVSRASRLAAERRSFNMVVTNVPGPQLPLYFLGAPLREIYPVVPLLTNQALGTALFSYDGSLYWGLNADWNEVPDLHAFVDALEASFQELHDAVGMNQAAVSAGA